MEFETSEYRAPSAAQIKEWTDMYGRLKKITLKSETEGEADIVLYFKKIDLKVLGLAQRAIAQEKDTIKYAEIILFNTVLNGKELLSDSEVFLSLMPVVDKLISGRVAVLEKN